MRGRRAWTAVLLAALLAGAGGGGGGCKPKAGGHCSGPGATCTDKASALFCADAAYVPMPCRGDKGCATTAGVVECDESIANEGDPCNALESIACAEGRKEALRCTAKGFVVDETCKGPTGCKIDPGQKISCDNDIADVGDPCHFIGDYACTTDKSLVMKCEGNKMTPHNTCRGPKQCKIVQSAKQERPDFSCDDSIAQDGDACDTNGEEACTMDRKGMYVCRGNKFGSVKPCAGGCIYDEKTDRYTCKDTEDGGAPSPAPAPVLPKRHGRR